MIEATYSEDEVTTGFCKSKASHAHRATKEAALYFSESMVSDSWYENLIISRAQVAQVILQYPVMFLENMSNGAADQK